jgi:spore germination cell wall hydrolase CwlJ-like protein
LLATCAAVALSQNSDKLPIVVPISVPQQVVIAQSPVELAAARMVKEQECLAEAIYFEARGEGEMGQKAVAEVVLARTRSKYYPASICGVVHQGAGHGARFCQFSFACDGSLNKRKERTAWENSRQLASRILAGAVTLDGMTKSATAYHHIDVQPLWAGQMERVAQVGSHVFYKRLPYSARLALQAAATAPASGYIPAGDIAADPQLPSDEIQTDIKVPGAVSDGA